jgi:hypothetical protein
VNFARASRGTDKKRIFMFLLIFLEDTQKFKLFLLVKPDEYLDCKVVFQPTAVISKF